MKKIIVILLVLAMLVTMTVGCANTDTASNGATTSNSETQKIDATEFGSYEDILNEYSKKLREATPKLIEEYNEEAKNNQDGLMGLATISNEKVSELAEISVEGIQEMAELHLKKGSGSYDEYSEWADKLNAVYMEEAAKIQDAYMKSAS